MTRTIYVSFEVDASSYQEAESKVKQSLQTMDHILSDTILLNSEEKFIRDIINTNKIVHRVRI